MKGNMYVVFTSRAGNHLVPLCEVLLEMSSSVIHIDKTRSVFLPKKKKKQVGLEHKGFEALPRAQNVKSSVDKVSKKGITINLIDPNQTSFRKESG